MKTIFFLPKNNISGELSKRASCQKSGRRGHRCLDESMNQVQTISIGTINNTTYNVSVSDDSEPSIV